MRNQCNCGHPRKDHIYEEGACRPGFPCSCTLFSEAVLSLDTGIFNGLNMIGEAGPELVRFPPFRFTPADIAHAFGLSLDLLSPKPKEKTIMSIVENLRAKIAADKAKLSRIEALGEDDFADGAVLLFTKTFEPDDPRYRRTEPTPYAYAAIKSPKGWHLTGRETQPYDWASLVEFMSENVETVEVVTEVEGIA